MENINKNLIELKPLHEHYFYKKIMINVIEKIQKNM